MMYIALPTYKNLILDKHLSSTRAELAQSVERTTLNRVVVGSIPTFGAIFFSLPLSQVVVLHNQTN